jgi:hypothetical protein
MLLGLYTGMAGWVATKALQNTSVAKPAAGSEQHYYEFEGLTFADEDSLRDFLQERRSSRWFPWIFEVPQELTPLIASMAFGLVGGAARLLKRVSLDGKRVSSLHIFSEPLFGSVIGLMIFFLSLVLPAVFTSGKNPVRPEALVGFSLFGGAFSEQAYDWLESQVSKLFVKKPEARPARKSSRRSDA